MPPLADDRLPDGVLVIRHGVIREANRRARQLLGGRDPVGATAAERLDLRNDAGLAVTVPTEPPIVGHRYAERVLHLAVPGGRRTISCSGAWVGDDLVITLRHAGRREAAVRTQADVVATVAHELRSPLTSVKGFTRTLLSRWDRFSDEQKHTMLAAVEADTDRVTRLLTDLLDVARIDAGRVKLRRTPVPLDELLGTSIAKARVRAPDRDLDHHVAPSVPSVLADADKLEQIVTNLLDNAIQHAPGSPVQCEAVREGDEVRIRVRDHGPGIAPEDVDTLFTKFGRGHSEHRAGTGLGLYVTKGLVEAHGGRIAFDLEVEDGALVEVWIPIEHT